MTKKTIHTEKELILSRKLNKKIKTIENKIKKEIKSLNMERYYDKNIFLSSKENKINSISIIKNEKNLDIAKLELERIKNLIPIQYK
ncbi:hypothetical protein [Gallibacterium anatis]|uniref:hypothetical protein n=1 Tax=Gallibacterium anatis TaxID=750 RepID=UPI0005317A55|nr:hypothetical protein [Gallibacterium anatis]KGQ44066.1 hypothetical protein JP29_09460 [Gallibacterium anatis]KGQ66053.1 hypothetical protein IO43_00200 [Gallibacterium anatis 7990]